MRIYQKRGKRYVVIIQRIGVTLIGFCRYNEEKNQLSTMTYAADIPSSQSQILTIDALGRVTASCNSMFDFSAMTEVQAQVRAAIREHYATQLTACRAVAGNIWSANPIRSPANVIRPAQWPLANPNRARPPGMARLFMVAKPPMARSMTWPQSRRHGDRASNA